MCEGLTRMGWSVEKPKAGMFVWVKIPEPWCRMGSVKFAVAMMEQANVAVPPAPVSARKGTAICAWHWWKTKTASAKASGRCAGR